MKNNREAEKLMGKVCPIIKVGVPADHLEAGKEYVVFGDLAEGELYLNILNQEKRCVEQIARITEIKRTVELEPIEIKYEKGMVISLKRKAKAGTTFSTRMIRLEFE